MTKGALAVIDFAADRWSKIKWRGGSLALYATPAHAEAEK
jgi:hypothetical protein